MIEILFLLACNVMEITASDRKKWFELDGISRLNNVVIKTFSINITNYICIYYF